MKSVALHNLGCKVNAYEFDVMQQMLQEKGYQIVSFDERADIYIVNTCSVTNMADRKSRQMLHKAKKMNPEAIVIATGCYVQTGEDELEEDVAVDLIIGNNKKKDLTDIIEEFLEQKQGAFLNKTAKPDKTLGDTTVIDINKTDEYEEMQLTHTAEHTRAYIKIQDGCNQFCTYCIIPYARGRVRSRKPEDILREVAGLVKTGYREVVLTGIHLSSYGVDFVNNPTEGQSDYMLAEGVGFDKKTLAFEREFLLKLIEDINKTEGIERIRLGSLEPRIITPRFVEKLSALEKLCPHFHLSLQSGCNETLKRMNRHYTAEEYLEKVEILRKYFPDAAITTDVIVGFPGETKEEFEITKAYLTKIEFYEMHIFKFSKRQGTPAAEMKNQVPDMEKNLRSDELLTMELAQSEKYRRRFLDKEVTALMEEEKIIDELTYQIGHTKEYVKVAKQTEEPLSNWLVTGVVTGFLQNDILLMQ